MESHPVPQNVTSFEFHLVGDMTLKQFTYLASGLSFAYAIFAFLADKPFPINAASWLVIFISSILGVAFAFLPIAERPLDHWVAAFFKAVFTPTERVWQSGRKDIARGDPVFNKRLNIYLSMLGYTEPVRVQIANYPQQAFPVAPAPNPAPAPIPPPVQPTGPPSPPTIQIPETQPSANPSQAPISQIILPQEEPNQPENVQKPIPASQLPSPQELNLIVQLAEQLQNIQAKISQTGRQLDDIKKGAVSPGANHDFFANQFQQVAKDMQFLTNQASQISYKLAVLSKSPINVKPSKITVVPVLKKPTGPEPVLTSTANVINGIVADLSNNYLEGVIVVAHNKEGMPVRALKTNKLGQFIAATPLTNGTYLLTLEKDGFLFDNLQVELEGNVMAPIKISAKRM